MQVVQLRAAEEDRLHLPKIKCCKLCDLDGRFVDI